jgi:phosphodiesterase/alkaline phosphatase D-like protein
MLSLGLLSPSLLGLDLSAQQALQNEALLAVDDRSRFRTVADADRIVFALYTFESGVLRLSAHLSPPRSRDDSKVILEVQRDGEWRSLGTADVHPIGFTAVFRIEGITRNENLPYRVRNETGAEFTGLLRADPGDRDEIVVGAFTGNSPGPGGGKYDKSDVVAAVRAVDPDLLVFTGDQVYDHFTHTASWLEFGRTFRDILRDRPTICLPDDHDVGQPNLWGQSGRKIDLDTKGGYTRPVGYVQMVERQQTSHLPDPVDPVPIEQGIGTYFTRLRLGGIDFALLEDRKFKSGCFGLVTEAMGSRPDHVEIAGVDPARFDRPEFEMLGARQEGFLARWSGDWSGVAMKCVVSQTTFAMTSTHHGRDRAFYHADFDSNGWPQTARDRALRLLRRATAFHLCGDQHLATIVQYGIDGPRDAGFAFCVPSIANLWPRWWAPATAGSNPEPDGDDYTGDFRDGFGNHVTVFAHTNPRPMGREPAELHDRMPGFGVVRFRKSSRTIRLECWPRGVDPTAGDGGQYRGWPREIRQIDALGVHAYALPVFSIEGAGDPAISVYGMDGIAHCHLRMGEPALRIPVPSAETYRVRFVREDGATVELLVAAHRADEAVATIPVRFP